MYLVSRKCLLLSLAMTLSLAGCVDAPKPKENSGVATAPPPAPPPDVAPSDLMPPTASFSKALEDFTSQTTTTNVNPYARNLRRDMIVLDLANYFSTPKFAKKVIVAKRADTFLCRPHYNLEVVSRPIQNLDSTAKALATVSSAPSTDAGTLLKDLSHKYSVSLPDTKTVSANYDEWKANEGAQCVAGLTGSQGYTPDPYAVRAEAAVEMNPFAAEAAAKDLFDTIWSIAKPLVVAVGTKVDNDKRTRAIQDFFDKPENVALLKSNLKATDQFLDEEFLIEKERAAGSAVTSLGILYDQKSLPWEAAMKIASTKRCRAGLANLGNNKVDPVGTDCFNSIMAALDTPIEAALNSADAYDSSYSKTLPKDKLSDQVDTLQQIATGGKPGEDRIEQLWKSLLEYNSLFQTTSDTFSKANGTKVDQAVDKLKAALK